MSSIRSLVSLVGGVAMMCCSVPCLAEEGSDWDSLKLYRTYHYVMQRSEQAHYFDVWFHGMQCSVPGNTPEQIMALTRSDFECLWGGIAPPPCDVPPVSDDVNDFNHLAEAIIDRMAELFPDASDISILYSGDFSRIKIGAVTPIASDGGLKLISRLSFAISAESPELRFYGLQVVGGLTLSPMPSAEICDPTPCFVDFVMPAEIEGSCLACGHYEGAGGGYPSAWSDFVSAVLATDDAIDRGTYANPIGSIFSAQGDTLLPPGFNQYAEYTIKTYLRGEGGRNETVKLQFPVSNTVSGPVTRVFRSRLTGLVYRATLDLGLGMLTTEVSTPRGEHQELSIPVEVELIRDGDVVALDDLPRLDMAWEDRQMSFSGFGDVTGIDVFLDKIRGARVFPPRADTLNHQPFHADVPSPVLW